MKRWLFLLLALALLPPAFAHAQITPGASGHIIQDEGTVLPQQPYLNFAGAGVACTTAATHRRTTCQVAGGGAAVPTSFAVGDLLYADTTTPLARLADVATGRVLVSGGVNTAPAWSATPPLGVAGATLGTLALAGNTSGTVTLRPAATAGTWTWTLPTTDGNAGDGLQTDGAGVTQWTAPKQIEVLADAATITPALGTDGRPYLGTVAALSQASQFANPTGTPANGQFISLRVISSSARALTWGTKYKGSTGLPLPTTSTGSSLRDYFGFIYESTTDTYDFVASTTGIG